MAEERKVAAQGRIIPVTIPELVTLLEGHRTIGSAPHAELEWIASHADLREYGLDEGVSRQGDAMENMMIILSGRIEFLAGPARKRIIEWRAGDITGVLPYSRMASAPGEAIVREAARAIQLHKSHFPELTRECPGVTSIAVHVMLDRARLFNTSDLHDEKMASLGRLSAGLAHELNNPASAASRSANQLGAELVEAEDAAMALGATGLTPAERTAVDRLRKLCLAGTTTGTLSPLERADREEALAEWLDVHDVSVPPTALTDSPITIADLDRLAGELSDGAVAPAIRAIATGLSTRELAMEIEKAASRIYQLVSAVKGFTYMDRGQGAEPVDVARGVSDTLAVHASKAREKGIAVKLDVQPTIPTVNAFGGELNQIWSNLLDNAIDAATTQVSVSVTNHSGNVVVSFVDDGSGIPPDVLPRIFDQFFTTKGVGKGTGLGLDIVRRITRRHDGKVEVDSAPGRTEFRVSLPVRAEGPNVPPQAPH